MTTEDVKKRAGRPRLTADKRKVRLVIYVPPDVLAWANGETVDAASKEPFDLKAVRVRRRNVISELASQYVDSVRHTQKYGE